MDDRVAVGDASLLDTDWTDQMEASMTDKKSAQPDKVRDLLFEDLDDHLVRAVGFATSELVKDAASLRGLAKSLEELAALPMAAGHDELRETAACIKAAGMQALAVALGTLSVSEQLDAYAGIRLVTGDNEDPSREEFEGSVES
jgi:hypothetical protein